MRILFVTHLYLPRNICGSEIYLHQVIKFLQSKGHECRVLLMPFNQAPLNHYEYDGVEVFPGKGQIDEYFNRADAVVAQLPTYSWYAVNIALMKRKKAFHITHSGLDQKVVQIDYRPGEVGVIYNSETARQVINHDQKSIVVHPPIRKFHVENSEKNKHITLINLSQNKGAPLFYEIAKRMPDRKFLAIKGTYGEQITSNLPNVTTLEPTTDIESVYRQTRILLVPSEQESFSMCAGEAIAAGIPVICSGTPGLRENLGEAGIYAHLTEEYIQEIRRLDNKKSYLSRREICLLRSSANSSRQISELDNFERFLHDG